LRASFIGAGAHTVGAGGGATMNFVLRMRLMGAGARLIGAGAPLMGAGGGAVSRGRLQVARSFIGAWGRIVGNGFAWF